MRCKPGDIAVVIGFQASPCKANLGKFVEVLEFCGDDGWTCRALSEMVTSWGRVDPPGAIGFVYDRLLRPIRDNDGQDETLAWKETPTQILKELTRHE